MWRTTAEAEEQMRWMPGHETAAALYHIDENSPPDVVRCVVENAWVTDHMGVRRYAQSLSKSRYEDGERRELLKLFRRANFDVSNLPAKLTAWRGGVCWHDEDTGAFQAPFTLAQGASWTRDRGVACFFATTYRDTQWILDHKPNAMPCVVEIELDRRHVLAHFTDRNEDEIITLPRNLRIAHRARVDGVTTELGADLFGEYCPSEEQLACWRAASRSSANNPRGTLPA